MPADRPSKRKLLQRLHGLENTLSPDAFLAAVDAARATGDDALAKVLGDSLTGQDLAAQSCVERFRPRPVSTDATLFLGGRRRSRLLAGPRRRRLLVLFTGLKRRPMLPLPVFLQRLDSRSWDVLVLRDGRRSYYRDGCDGLGHTMPQIARTVRLLGRPYRGITSFGTSMGGLAAIRLLLAGGAERAVAIGPRRPWDMRRIAGGGANPVAFDPVCACLPRADRDILCACSGDHPIDLETAAQIVGTCGGTLLREPGVSGHNLLASLWRAGDLDAFMRAVLDPAEPFSTAPTRFAAERRTRSMASAPVTGPSRSGPPPAHG